MTLQQKAYRVMKQMSKDDIKVFINIIENVQKMPASTFQLFITDVKDSVSRNLVDDKSDTITDDMSEIADMETFRAQEDVDIVDTIDIDAIKSMTKAEKKQLFMQSAGKMKIDSDAIHDLRERSMI